MCGIAAMFFRESVPDYQHLHTMFTGLLDRGRDGFGIVHIRNENGIRTISKVYRSHENYDSESCLNECRYRIYPELRVGDVLIAIQRAAPETENATDPSRINVTMQPIYSDTDNIVCVHNGAVSGRIHRELREWADTSKQYHFRSVIDSESIIASYVKHQRNMKNAFEYLSGGFASIIYDERKDSLFVVNDHMQVAHSYIRGIGFFIHSDVEPMRKMILDITGCRKDGVNIWETYYCHFLDGGSIREVDLQSGFMKKTDYNPRYFTQNFDTSTILTKGI